MAACVILAIKNFILISSILRFEAFLSAPAIRDFVKPDRTLMIWHFVNVVVYILILGALIVLNQLYLRADEKGDQIQYKKHKAEFSYLLCLQGTFQLYNVIFMFVLLLRQTKKGDSSKLANDNILNKKVSPLVFV